MKSGFIRFVGSRFEFDAFPSVNADLVLCFGDKYLVGDQELFTNLKSKFTNAHLVMFSTSGEINDGKFSDGGIAGVALDFEKTKIDTHSFSIPNFESSFELGASIAKTLQQPDLQYIMVISDGSIVNGSELVRGINNSLISSVPVTGGLAGDGERFDYTLVGLNRVPSKGEVVAIGFYGSSLKVSHGSYGGWEPFGPEMMVTKSADNVLYEIENRSSLDIYSDFLGDYSKELPSSALLFPISLKVSVDSKPIVRTILGVDFEKKTMTFAGNIPEGSYIRFMKSSLDKLIEAAATAASECGMINHSSKEKFAFLVSCVGRKIVMSRRVEEEIEAVNEVFGPNTLLSGFYSYGEICPILGNELADLHNQTMTITLLSED